MHAKFLSATLIGALLASACSDDSSGKKALSGSQTGSASVDLATGTLSLVQPKQIKLSGTAVVDDPTDTVTISLTITNKSKTLLQNAKALVTNVSEGTVTGDGSFGPSPLDGVSPPYVYYGPEGIPTGTEVSRDVVVDGVTSTSGELTMDLEIVVHPWLFLPANDDGVVAVDSSGSGEALNLFTGTEIEDLGFEFDSWQRADATSPDGRRVYYTNRNQPAVLTFDTVDQTLTIGDSLIGGTIAFDGTGVVGSIDGLRASPDGKFVYATVNHGTHVSTFDSPNWTTPTEVEVVKLKAETLAVADRVTVWTPPLPSPGDGGGGPPYNPDILGRRISITPDGTRGAVSITGASEVSMLNLNNMTVMDTWTVGGFVPRHAAISPDASQIAVCYNWRDDNDGTLEMIDVAAGTVATLAPPTLDAGTSTYSGFLEWGPDGRLYYGRAWNSTVPGVSIYDPAGPSWSEVTGVYGNEIAFREDSWWLWDDDNSEVHFYDYTDVEQTFPATGAAGLGSVAAWGHGMVFTD